MNAPADQIPGPEIDLGVVVVKGVVARIVARLDDVDRRIARPSSPQAPTTHTTASRSPMASCGCLGGEVHAFGIGDVVGEIGDLVVAEGE